MDHSRLSCINFQLTEDVFDSFIEIIDEVIDADWAQYQVLGNISGLAIKDWGRKASHYDIQLENIQKFSYRGLQFVTFQEGFAGELVKSNPPRSPGVFSVSLGEKTYFFINWGDRTSVPSQPSPATKKASVEPVPGATEDHSLTREQLGAGVWPTRVLHLQTEGPLLCCSELLQESQRCVGKAQGYMIRDNKPHILKNQASVSFFSCDVSESVGFRTAKKQEFPEVGVPPC
ncbi:uncharacterized protein [Chamaea fasciata]|uniref:uncharacterized protein n=1 Tax=Chamaea fasciata TaxID=190680 RepID=UPI00336A035B